MGIYKFIPWESMRELMVPESPVIQMFVFFGLNWWICHEKSVIDLNLNFEEKTFSRQKIYIQVLNLKEKQKCEFESSRSKQGLLINSFNYTPISMVKILQEIIITLDRICFVSKSKSKSFNFIFVKI